MNKKVGIERTSFVAATSCTCRPGQERASRPILMHLKNKPATNGSSQYIGNASTQSKALVKFTHLQRVGSKYRNCFNVYLKKDNFVSNLFAELHKDESHRFARAAPGCKKLSNNLQRK
jgi:hypothetical protein